MRLGKFTCCAAAAAALVVCSSTPIHAAFIGADNASNAPYNDGWQTGDNGGTGFQSWTLRANQGSGASGQFLDSAPSSDNSIVVSNKSWGTYANGTGFQDSVAFRAFGGGGLGFGQSFSVSMDNGNVQGSPEFGSAGIVLRVGNANASTADYNVNKRFEFFFLGGDSNYKLVDAAGSFDTGIGFTTGGLDLTFTLTSATTYDLKVFRRSSSQTFTFTNRTLTATTPLGVESVALYNRNTESANVYFNSLAITPEPASLAVLSGVALLMLRRRSTR